MEREQCWCVAGRRSFDGGGTVLGGDAAAMSAVRGARRNGGRNWSSNGGGT
ncbi:UNVERIFIED_CONTAM: hypothetical protein Sradi_5217000 [Sesamum radiatum]|uniref:Uncharacterized protein n=1 Tax=Sesamum radiatum TaxID=300843 RepID=A0AAW2LMI6_SESRA